MGEVFDRSLALVPRVRNMINNWISTRVDDPGKVFCRNIRAGRQGRYP